ncbi:GTP-binding protein [Acetobacterium sp.]|jgi:G3E family GTPase|uniref:GTP-binding protein n=1 Tax=Acetobacterium sp. TaxID=1872094 RepID=UPI000CAA7730|nr:GTP-binding protein [Acetobacterium sp.]MDO9493909.1 GTP-binding protein [Acetobacterium sp.]PKM74947.1 MAG: cobalamin biosynthesis protein CobW [Firmicutes bacterium HGW-Firmicutes-17]
MCDKNHKLLKSRPPIILFTGFLGSGKTTMLLKTIEMLSAADKKCAIIINEIGDVGIDNRQMRMLGYEVLDLFGGCVCCTMKVTLEATINHLLEGYQDLDYILFEPSGMANPLSMYPAMMNCGYREEEIQNVFIFDPTRVVLYEKRMNQLFNDSINLARCVVINKLDEVGQREIEEAVKMVETIRPGLRTFKMNLKNELCQEFHQYL